MIKEVFIVTSSRADFGLLKNLAEEIRDDKDLNLNLVVTGMHLCKLFGNTINEVSELFKISYKIETLTTDNNLEDVTKSIGDGVIKFGKLFNKHRPDLVIILGDRYEILSVSIAALINKIPVAHIHGGEKTEGAFDDSIRHSISKMSHLHFVSHEEYRKRVIQLGENPKKVFNVGAIGLDSIKKMNLIKKNVLEELLSLKFNNKNLLVTFHPVTLDKQSSVIQIKTLLNALVDLKDTSIIITSPNADPEGIDMIKTIEDFVKDNSNFYFYRNLGQLNYFSCIDVCDAVIGNSSSGIIEVASFKKGTINIGDRQKGRLHNNNVINCEPTIKDIKSAINELYSDRFQKSLRSITNPYGDGNSSKKIIKIIKKVNINDIINKSFYDISF